MTFWISLYYLATTEAYLFEMDSTTEGMQHIEAEAVMMRTEPSNANSHQTSQETPRCISQ